VAGGDVRRRALSCVALRYGTGCGVNAAYEEANVYHAIYHPLNDK